MWTADQMLQILMQTKTNPISSSANPINTSKKHVSVELDPETVNQ